MWNAKMSDIIRTCVALAVVFTFFGSIKWSKIELSNEVSSETGIYRIRGMSTIIW